MKERRRWKANEDSLLYAYVKQYGPREWNLVSLRMNTHLNRDAKSCLQRWKNYPKPGIKKGSLTEEEQHLVIRLQAKVKHGNKWKKIAAELPDPTAKRLGKWWKVFKEKQQREQKENSKTFEPLEEGKYDWILETFSEKLVRVQSSPPFLMASSNGGILHTDPSASAPTLLPSWLSSSSGTSAIRPPSPSVTLSLSSSTIAQSSTQIPWLHPERGPESGPIVLGNLTPHISVPSCGENPLMTELVDCCRELEDGHRAWASHKKEAAWRLRRIELQLLSEKTSRKREKMDEIEAKVKTLREEQKITLERIELEYKEQLAALKRDAEAKEQKLAEQWAAKHSQLSKFLERVGCRSRVVDSNGR